MRLDNRWLQMLLAVALAALLIWFAFRNTSFSEVWQQLTAMRVAPMLLAVALATLPFLMRVPRWSLLLRREDGSALPPATLWHAIAIGFAANNTLPFRLGELLRMGAISRLGKVPFASAFSSVAIERVLDALAAVALLAIGLFFAELPSSSAMAGKATALGTLGVLALLTAIAVARHPVLISTPARRLLPEGRLRDGFLSLLDRLVAGLRALGSWRHALPLILWSLSIWLVNAAAFWTAFAAFGIEVPFSGALVLQGALLVGISLPSTPGYAGVFEATIATTLSVLYGVDAGVAMAYAIAYHIATFIPITLLGLYSMVSTGVTVRSAREATAQ